MGHIDENEAMRANEMVTHVEKFNVMRIKYPHLYIHYKIFSHSLDMGKGIEKPKNKELLKEFVNEQLIKVNEITSFDENVKIAFGFNYNGIAIINAFEKEIDLGHDVKKDLSTKQIAADGTGFPKTSSLKRIFELST